MAEERCRQKQALISSNLFHSAAFLGVSASLRFNYRVKRDPLA
jgi:hypothetical protein